MQITHFDDNVKGVVFRNRYHCHDIHDTSWINYAENNEKGKGFYETKDIKFLFVYLRRSVTFQVLWSIFCKWTVELLSWIRLVLLRYIQITQNSINLKSVLPQTFNMELNILMIYLSYKEIPTNNDIKISLNWI